MCFFKYSIFSSPPWEVFFTVDLLTGQPADWTTIEITTLLIIYLPGRGALLRQLIKSVKDLYAAWPESSDSKWGRLSNMASDLCKPITLSCHGDPNNPSWGCWKIWSWEYACDACGVSSVFEQQTGHCHHSAGWKNQPTHLKNAFPWCALAHKNTHVLVCTPHRVRCIKSHTHTCSNEQYLNSADSTCGFTTECTHRM